MDYFLQVVSAFSQSLHSQLTAQQPGRGVSHPRLVDLYPPCLDRFGSLHHHIYNSSLTASNTSSPLDSPYGLSSLSREHIFTVLKFSTSLSNSLTRTFS